MKSGVEDFVLFGGAPVFATPLLVGRPNVGQRDRLFDRLNDLLDRCWLSNDGPYVQEFRAVLASRLGVRHVVAVVNGTVGLDIAVRVAGLIGEVIVPSFTFARIGKINGLLLPPRPHRFCDLRLPA